MNYAKTILILLLSLTGLHSGIAQDFQKTMTRCIDHILNTQNLSIYVQVRAMDPIQGAALENTTIHIHHRPDLLYSKMMGRESFFDLSEAMAYMIDPQTRVASISRLEGSHQSLRQSMQQMFGITEDLPPDVQIEQERKDNLDVFRIIHQGKVSCEYTVDVASESLISAVVYPDRKYTIEQKSVQPYIRFDYTYVCEKLNVSHEHYFMKNADIWTLKPHLADYKFIDATSIPFTD